MITFINYGVTKGTYCLTNNSFLEKKNICFVAVNTKFIDLK